MNAALTWRLTVAALQRFTSQRVLGWLWWVLDPLLMIAVYAVVIGSIRRHPVHEYPLFLACAVIPWRWHAVTTTRGANALISNAGLLTATPVDRHAVVVSEVLASTIEACLGIPVLLAFMVWYGRAPSWELLWVPLPLVVMGVLACGIAFLLSPLNVLMRDTSNAYAACLRVVWFLSPGFYALDEVPVRAGVPGLGLDVPLRSLATWLNPFTGILEGVRRPIFAAQPPEPTALLASAVWAVAALLVGLRVFRRTVNAAVRMF